MFALSMLLSAAQIIVSKVIFPYGTITPWHGFSVVFEALFMTALFAFRPSIKAVLIFQFIVGATFRTVNQVKINYLNSPIIPSDFFLLRDALQILSWPLIITLICLIALVIGTLIFILKGVEKPKGKSWLAVFPAASILTCLIGFPATYDNIFQYFMKDQLIGIPFLLRERAQSLGTFVSFSIDVAKYLTVAFNIPSEEEVVRAITKLKIEDSLDFPPGSTSPRNVYVILAESFWDASFIDFQGTQPLAAGFQSLWKDNGGHHFLSPTYGGGTANVEFEVLCGMPARSAGKGIIFQTALSNRLTCLPKILSDHGYRSFAFHAFAPQFYNRNTAFPAIGFERFFSLPDFQDHPGAGEFVPDRPFIIRSVMKAREEANGKPFLAYMMTFAAHWPYAWIPPYESENETKFNMTQDLGEAGHEIERYFNINRISSRVIADQVEAIQKADPTALIVVAGDHLPEFAVSLDPSQADRDIRDVRFFKTPLLLVGLHKVKAQGEVPAYEIGRLIMSELGIAQKEQAHFPLFEPPPGLSIRGVENGSTFVRAADSKNFVLCLPYSKTPPCDRALEWLLNVKTIAIDQVAGSQFSAKKNFRDTASAPK
jgi:phosphoglycerol transferase MdoB-like AlkP superfamily enzyme